METHGCPMSSCAAPAGSPCRTSKGRVANARRALR
ncbi:zinc finger domain-containing protein [Planobispora takensis]